MFNFIVSVCVGNIIHTYRLEKREDNVNITKDCYQIQCNYFSMTRYLFVMKKFLLSDTLCDIYLSEVIEFSLK
jgi:hypothetical protein